MTTWDGKPKCKRCNDARVIRGARSWVRCPVCSPLNPTPNGLGAVGASHPNRDAVSKRIAEMDGEA